MQAVTDAHAAAMMKRNPTGAAGGIQERIEDRPVSNCVRSVLHPFGFTERRGNRSRVEMVTPNRDWRFQIAAAHEFIDGFTHLGALAVTQPADARRQSLELHPIARKPQPAIQSFVLGKKFERQIISLANVFGFARERDPAKRPFTFAE